MGEKTKKYHVTDDGDIYRINDDGSFTSMGNAEKMSESNVEDSVDPVNNQCSSKSNINPVQPFVYNNSHKRFWICVIIFLIFIICGVLYVSTTSHVVNSTSEFDLDTIAVSDVPIEIVTSEVPEPTQEIASASIKDFSHKNIQQVIPETESNKPNVKEIAPVESQARSESLTSSSIDPNKVYYSVEVQAEFPGGDRSRKQWLRDNISWPNDADGVQLHGNVELDFIIERDGSVSNVKVSYSENSELNSAAVRLISSMPAWSPAKIRNQPVRSPIGITLFF